MKEFNKEQFLELAQISDYPVATIYIPTSRKSNNGYQDDIIHFKNQLSLIEKEIGEKMEWDEKESKKYLSNAKALLDDFGFWQHNSDLLACFITPSEFKTFQLPINNVSPSYFISSRPYLMPLIEELNGNGSYYLLLLNLDRIHLFKADKNHIEEVILDEVEIATSFTREEEQDENQKQLHGQGSVGYARAMYHGHGDGSDEEKKVTIQNYFHRMTNMLEPKLYKNPLPLFIAGVEYLGPIFKETFKYHLLQEGQVIGAFKPNDKQELHEKSWVLAKEIFEEDSQNRKEAFGLQLTQKLALDNDVDKIIKTAMTGGIQSLFIEKGQPPIWGKYDDQNFILNKSPDHQEGEHCLLDLASMKTLEYGGEVFLLNPEEMPTKHPISATLRYEV
jgi:hypothetical protein